MSMSIAQPRSLNTRSLDATSPEGVGWGDVPLLAAMKATSGLARGRQALEDLRTQTANGAAPVVVIVIGVVVVAAAGGLVAFLTTWCVAQGYAGFGAVLNVQEINNGTQYSVSFQCIPWPWDA